MWVDSDWRIGNIAFFEPRLLLTPNARWQNSEIDHRPSRLVWAFKVLAGDRPLRTILYKEFLCLLYSLFVHEIVFGV